MGVTVTFPELPGEAYSAVISRTAGALDPTSNTMEVQIDIDNREGKIKPGMYARVKINLESREGVLSLPLTASVIHENEFFVYVVNDGIVEKISIRKGLSNKDYFEVLNTQLNEKSLVIIQGKSLVTVGQKVDAVLKTKE
jgi:multidrug efflux pump subunit AcrA (membrane-fusion protein)